MGRELRKVPANWKHPKKDDGSYQPLHNKFYGDVLNQWIKDHKKWENGKHPDIKENPERKKEYPFLAMWEGDPPDVKYYHTEKYEPQDLTHIQLYESTSEGTPLSPVFKASELEKLCEWASENATTFASFKASKKEWMDMLNDGFVYHQQGNAIFM